MTHARRFAFLAAGLLGLLAVEEAFAAPYPIEILIDDESDIDELYYDGEIDEDTRDRLLTLYLSRVDINTAGRDELYELPGFTYPMVDAILAARKEKGKFEKVEDLQALPAIPEDVMRQALPFLYAGVPPEVKSYDGEVRLGGIYRTEHDDPAFYLRAKGKFLSFGGAGLLMAVRPQIGKVHGALDGDSLTADRKRERFDPAAFYAFWDTPQWGVIGGSYRVGFGQRLTVDNSRRNRPHGWYPSNDYVESSESGSLNTLDGFMGVAARYKELQAGPGWFDMTVFGSVWLRDLYFTDIYYNRCPAGETTCSDSKKVPTIVEDTETYIDSKGNVKPVSLYCDFPTLPRVLREITSGANVTYWFDDRNSIGLTGVVGNWHMQVTARDISPGRASRYPTDRTMYGAAGIDGRLGLGPVDVGAEASFTDKGSPAILVKGEISPIEGLQILPTFRYYSPQYDNPYSHGDADADEYLGSRARDELGGRLIVNYRPIKMLRLRADVDLWHHEYAGVSCDPDADPDDARYCQDVFLGDQPKKPSTDMETLFRVDVSPTTKERFSVWTVYHDRDLSKGGRGLSYEPYSNSQGDFSGGARLYWAATAMTTRIPRVTVSAMFKQIFEDSYQLTTKFDRSWYAWLRIAANLRPGPLIAVRVKYYDESSVGDPDRSDVLLCDWEERDGTNPAFLPASCRGETYWDAYLQATQPLDFLGRGSSLRVRGEWTRWTDHRMKWKFGVPCDSTPARNEFLVKGYLQVRF